MLVLPFLASEKSPKKKNRNYTAAFIAQNGISILAAGQEKALYAIHVAEANLNMVLLANLGAYVSDIAFVKGSTDRIVYNRIFSVFK